MYPERMEALLRNVDRRVARIEQKLPTLATRAELEAAIEPLATKADLQAAISSAIEPLATKAQLQATIDELEQRMRIHFDVVTESLRDDIQLIATGLADLSQRER